MSARPSAATMLLLASFTGLSLAAVAYVYVRRRVPPSRPSTSSLVAQVDDDLIDPSAFQSACDASKRLVPQSIEVQLQLYGLYKRVTHGVAPRSQRPPMWDLAGEAKYDAWVQQTDKTRQQAAEEYEALVNKLRKAGGDSAAGSGGASTGPRVSKMMDTDESTEPLPDTPYERFKALIGHASEARLRMEASIDLVAERDEEHRTLLHWAADGNHLEAIQVLVDAGADVNAQDDEELTPLTYAVCNDYVDAAKLLVRLGADTATAREFARGEMLQLLE